MIDIKALVPEPYEVRPLEKQDVGSILQLYMGNPYYFKCRNEEPAREDILGDMEALPTNCTYEQKYYLGFYKDGTLITVLDLIDGFPTKETAYIGFFMMEAGVQGKGLGSKLVSSIKEAMRQEGFARIELAYVTANEQSQHFWHKNGFVPTGKVTDCGAYTITSAAVQL